MRAHTHAQSTGNHAATFSSNWIAGSPPSPALLPGLRGGVGTGSEQRWNNKWLWAQMRLRRARVRLRNSGVFTKIGGTIWARQKGEVRKGKQKWDPVSVAASLSLPLLTRLHCEGREGARLLRSERKRAHNHRSFTKTWKLYLARQDLCVTYTFWTWHWLDNWDIENS